MVPPFADAADLFMRHASTIQAVLFFSVIMACWLLEHAFAGPHRARKRRRAGVNFLVGLLVLPVQVGMATFLLLAVGVVTTYHWGLIYLLPAHENPWLRFGLMFVLLDFLDWIYHWAMHRVPLFWRFHLVHHTDQDMDSFTTGREHPGETLVRNGFLILWVFVCGASLEVLVLRQTVETVANILAHTSFRLGDRAARVLGAVFITPNLHHVHHHNRLPYTNSNYGDVFSVWDRLFGTLRTLALEHTVFGLDTHPSPRDHSFAQAMAIPFGTPDAAVDQAAAG